MIASSNVLNNDDRDRRRFWMISSGIGVAVCVSSTYCFSIYSNSLKTQFNLGQDQITTISTFSTAFGMFSIPAGILFDFIGPTLVLFIATLMMSSGFLIWYLVFADKVVGTVVLFCVAASLVSWGSGWMDVGSLMTSILNFPKHRGSVVALQKTFMGLGSTILATCFVAFFDGHLDYFSLFMFVVVLFFGFVGTAVIRLPEYYVTTVQSRRMSEEEVAERRGSLSVLETLPASQRRFRFGYILLGINLVVLTTYNIVEAYVVLSHTTQVVCCSVCLSIFAAFFVMPLISLVPPEPDHPSDAARLEPEATSPSADDKLIMQNPTGPFFNSAPPQIEQPFCENVSTAFLWCLLWTSFCNLGTGVTVVMNSAQIYRALNDDKFNTSTNALFVALMGVGSAVARILVGYLDNRFQEQRSTAKTIQELFRVPLMTATYPVSSVINVVGLSLLLVVPVEGLLLPLFILAMAYGFIWASTACNIRMMFSRDVGKHYNFCFVGGLLAGIVINRFMFGQSYDDLAKEQGTYPFCTGVKCISTCVMVMIGLNVSSMVTAMYVHTEYKYHCQRRFPFPC